MPTVCRDLIVDDSFIAFIVVSILEVAPSLPDVDTCDTEGLTVDEDNPVSGVELSIPDVGNSEADAVAPDDSKPGDVVKPPDITAEVSVLVVICDDSVSAPDDVVTFPATVVSDTEPDVIDVSIALTEDAAPVDSDKLSAPVVVIADAGSDVEINVSGVTCDSDTDIDDEVAFAVFDAVSLFEANEVVVTSNPVDCVISEVSMDDN